MKAFAKYVHKDRMQIRHFPATRAGLGILEIIYLDVCGTMYSSSLSGYVYYVSYIYDFSHNTWIYYLKGKNELFSKFKEYKALV